MDPLELMMTLQVRALGYEVFDQISAALGRVADAGLSLNAIAPLMTLGGIGVAALGAAFVEAGIQAGDFATKTTEIANNANLSAAQLKDLQATTLQVAQNTGLATNDIATGYMHVADEGYHAKDATLVMNAAAESAASTGANVASVANVLAMTLHDWSLSGNAAAATMDTLHVASALSNVTLDEFVTGMRNAAPVASVLGVSVDDTAAAVATLTRDGFTAAQAGTQFRNFLTHLVAPTTGATKAIAELSQATGVDLTADFSQAALASKGLPAILQDIAKATGGNVEAFAQLTGETGLTTDQIDLMTQAANGNVAAMQKMMPATRGLYAEFVLTSTGAKDYVNILQQMTAAHQNGGVTAENFARWSQTLGAQMSILKENIHVAAIEIGSVFTPYLSAVVNFLINNGIPAFEIFAEMIGNGFVSAIQTAIDVWKTLVDFFTGGNLEQNLLNLLDTLFNFASNMFSAGVNLIEQLAMGMEQAAASILNAVVNEIANFIASFFVGMSPPPAGPLNKLPQGGAKAMASWVDGAQTGVAGIQGVADQASNALASIPAKSNTATLTTGLLAAKDAALGLKDAVALAKDNSVDLQRQLDVINEHISALNDQIKYITNDYQAQIQPLQDQLTALQNIQDIQFQINQSVQDSVLAQDKLAILKAQGDPAERARLQTEIESLQNQQQELSIQSQIADIEAKKKEAAGDPAKLEALSLKEKELQDQKALWDMTHNSTVDQLTQQDAVIKAKQEEAKAEEAVTTENRKQVELNLKKQIDDKKAAEQSAIQPLKEQVLQYQDAKVILQDQLSLNKQNTGHLQTQATLAGDLASRLGAASTAAKGLGAAGGGLPPLGGIPINPNLNSDLKNSTETAMATAVSAAQSAAKSAIEAWIESFKEGIAQHLNDIQAALSQFFNLKSGDVAASLLSLADDVSTGFQTLTATVTPYITGFVSSFISTLSNEVGGIASFVSPYITDFVNSLGSYFDQGMQLITGTVVPAVTGFVTSMWQELQSQFQSALTFVTPIVSGFASSVGQFLTSGFQTLTTSIIPNIIPFAQGVGNTITTGFSNLMDTVGPPITSFLGNIEGAVTGAISSAVSFVTPYVQGLPSAVGSLLSAGFGLLTTTILPAVWEFVQSVGTRLSDGFNQAVSAVTPSIQSFASGISTAIGNAFSGLGSMIPTIFGSIQSALSQAFSMLQTTVPALAATLGTAIGQMITTAFNMAQPIIGPAFQNFAVWLRNQFLQIMFGLNIATLAQQGGNPDFGFGEAIGMAIPTIQAHLTQFWNSVRLAFNQGLVSLGQMFGIQVPEFLAHPFEGLEAIVQFAADVISTLKDAFILLLPGIRLAGIIILGLAGAILVAVDAILNFIGWVHQNELAFRALEVVAGIVIGIFLVMASPIAAIVVAIVGLLAVLTLLQGALNQVPGLVQAMVNGVQGYIDAFRVNLEDFILWAGPNWTGLWQIMHDFAIDTWALIQSVFKLFIDTITGWIQVVTLVWQGDWGGAWTAMKTLLQTTLTDMVGIFTAQMAVIKDVLNGALTAAVALLQTFVGNFSQAGADVIGGFVQGLRDHAGDVLNTLKDIVQKAIDAVKSAFGIHSPSTVFHDIGTNVALGLANGMRAGAGDVANAASSLLSGTGLTAGVAAGGGTTVQIVVTGNYILDDQTGSRLADMVGEKVVDVLRTSVLTGRYQ